MTAAAPTSLPAKGPTQFITIGGSELALPPGAQRRIAYTWTDEPPPADAISAFTYVVAGDYYEVPILAFAQYSVTSDPYPSLVVFEVRDAGGNVVVQIPSPIQQPQDTNLYNYTFAVGLGAAYATNDFQMSSSATSVAAIPLPPLLLAPGFSWGITTTGAYLSSAGWADLYVQSLRIPSQSSDAAASRPSLQLT